MPVPECYRCDDAGAEVCVDDSLNEYDHHIDEPPGAGYPDGEAMFVDHAAEARARQAADDFAWRKPWMR